MNFSNFVESYKLNLPLFSEGRFEIEDYTSPCYIYEAIAPLRVLLMQKTAPKKYKKVNTGKLKNTPFREHPYMTSDDFGPILTNLPTLIR